MILSHLCLCTFTDVEYSIRLPLLGTLVGVLFIACVGEMIYIIIWKVCNSKMKGTLSKLDIEWAVFQDTISSLDDGYPRFLCILFMCNPFYNV